MNSLTARLTQSPTIARVAPFLLFVVLTACQEFFGESGRYWLYFAKTLVGVLMLWAVRHVVTEMRWKLSLPAVIAGIAVFALWVGLDYIIPTQHQLWTKLGLSKPPPVPTLPWNPFLQF